MKSYRTLLLATPLIILVGCNSGSPSSASKTKPAVVDKPLANYKFTEEAKREAVEERQEILEAMRLSYNGTMYSNMKFAEALGGATLIKLSDNKGKSVDLYLQSAEDSEPCVIYQNADDFDTFPCSQSVRSVSNETTVVSTTSAMKRPVQVEFYTEAEEHIGSIGSTILTPQMKDNQVNIQTSFAFNDFYKDILGDDGKGDRINSTLGYTTYLQLDEIVKANQGTNMEVRFNNHIGGSADDDINMYTGLLIKDNDMDTVVTATGSVFSGGTDLFAAGKQRTLIRSNTATAIEKNEQIGVHSWGQGDKTAKDFPYTDESHRKQATYFKKMMGDKGIDFYLFTLDSAPASGAHWVTKADSDKYGFITQIK
ncbi:alpha/beta hydrolase [Vibrio sp. 99-70-13A1]|uniref:alpha/beta hydrolase n=1 Tax=Vibrio sp. 99-70-13A1 TaxID=2607601 RepID=UPI00149330A6|nr:alpha/beta hydrolase [Vibrio sp. 99-70-13A1]NOH96660.1 alpha/beta hydrolase [Vibrio sp. 99-70-13A1]